MHDEGYFQTKRRRLAKSAKRAQPKPERQPARSLTGKSEAGRVSKNPRNSPRGA